MIAAKPAKIVVVPHKMNDEMMKSKTSHEYPEPTGDIASTALDASGLIFMANETHENADQRIPL